MKEIKINLEDSDFEYLKEMISNMRSQSNRCTRSPYYYTIQEDRKVYHSGWEMNDNWMWINTSRELEFDFDDESLKDYIVESCEDLPEDFEELWENNASGFEDLYFDDIVEKLGFEKYCYSIEKVYSNCFLTEKDAENHIRINKHNLCNPETYVDHAFRNRDMELVVNLLNNIVLDENDFN